MEKDNERKGEDSIMAKKKQYYERQYELFKKLPERAKLLFFQIMSFPFEDCRKNFHEFFEMTELDFDYCESPIEILMAISFLFVEFLQPVSTKMNIEISPQEDVETPNGNYRADFVIRLVNGSAKETDCLVVECDGHEFHEKTKEQVRKGLKRDYDIKMAGYDILHFSGSQIYENPIKCAYDVWDYIEKKWGGTNGN